MSNHDRLENTIIFAVVLALVGGCDLKPRQSDNQQPQVAAQQPRQQPEEKKPQQPRPLAKQPVVKQPQDDPKTKAAPKETPKPLEVVASRNPFTDFLDNAATAEAKFEGKGMEVNGVVNTIRKSKDGKGWVVFIQGYGNPTATDDRGYYCRFQDAESLKPLMANWSRAVIQGRFHHWNSNDKGLYVDDCKLLEVLEPNSNGEGLKSVWKASK